jgi:GNAT superfamily N-acetyltransferase
MVTVRTLDDASIAEAADLVAREHVAARNRQPLLPASYADSQHCRAGLAQLAADGYVGFVAHHERRCVGVICGRTVDTVGFVPAHGLAVDADHIDPTTVVVALLAELAPVMLRDGATRFTIDHIADPRLEEALNNAGFARGSVFATQPTRATAAPTDVDVRFGLADDLDAIATLSQVELEHRSTPPIYAASSPRTWAQARAQHEQLLHDGAVHFLARRAERDVALVTVEFTSPAPRLCPSLQPYIGPTASDPSARRQGIGSALVQTVLAWAHINGYESVSVDFDSANPLSRPFWLAANFQAVGYRTRRTLDPSYIIQPSTRRPF